jgi:hypothetical protein
LALKTATRGDWGEESPASAAAARAATERRGRAALREERDFDERDDRDPEVSHDLSAEARDRDPEASQDLSAVARGRRGAREAWRAVAGLNEEACIVSIVFFFPRFVRRINSVLCCLKK